MALILITSLEPFCKVVQFFFNWNRLHTRLISQYNTQELQQKEKDKDEKHTKKLIRENQQKKGAY